MYMQNKQAVGPLPYRRAPVICTGGLENYWKQNVCGNRISSPLL